jgi:predicted nucleic acid-binding protein
MKLYLDTSVISALFDEKNLERKFLTEAFFRIIKEFDVYISELTIAEIENTTDKHHREKLINAAKDLHILSINDEIEMLTNEYISFGAISDGFIEDAYHIAISVIHEMDYLLSWNFKHLVRTRTRDIVRMVNTIKKFKYIEIITPAELL